MLMDPIGAAAQAEGYKKGFEDGLAQARKEASGKLAEIPAYNPIGKPEMKAPETNASDVKPPEVKRTKSVQ